ncbi:MAG: Gfo/Idh/MocA family oxidoreductase [bacterium]
MKRRALGVGIIGCGFIGQKRAKSLASAKLVACADIALERARSVAATSPGAVALTRWEDVVCRKDVDVIVASTTNHMLAKITLSALKCGKHVLVEKPAARSARELDAVIRASKKAGRLVRVGFNHRYHPALRKAMEITTSGTLGKLMFVRSRYGHGGRLGYEKEWRANPELSGGGELMDQGVHLIDLARWFRGDFKDVSGFANTYYWQMPVDDNAFLLLKTAQQQAAFLHVSCTEWKNLFSMEIYGRDGKLDINGLGGSYGIERITHYRMLPQMGPPETTTWEYPAVDNSWDLEFSEFIEDIRLNRQPAAGLPDAHAALVVVEQVYAQSGMTQ